MPKTISQAFDKFLVEYVRLDSTDSDTAKASKNWLVSQIAKFSDDDKFPALHPNIGSIDFGSFSRKTKIRPLDDIDLMIVMDAQGNYRNEKADRIEIIVRDYAVNQKELCFDNTLMLNSRKVINKFKDKLASISQYRKADIKRNQEAVTLDLTSYPWVFDIVPCFITVPINGVTFFLIPDGNGHWKKSDPRIDKERINKTNQTQAASLYDLVRLVKFWNKRATMATMSSYMLEVMLVDYYQFNTSNASLRREFPNILNHIVTKIKQPIYDPKGFQGDLNTLTYDERISISNRASLDYQKAIDAVNFEAVLNHKDGIQKWIDVFGPNFPAYE